MNESTIHWSASEIARRIARREISAVEVTRAFIARIEEVNPALNAVVLPRFELAVKEAEAVDEQLRSTAGRASSGTQGGNHSPALLGVPVTLKECFHLAGMPSTIGLDEAAHTKPIEHDGVSVSRVRRAGAIVLGKTNLPQLMIWHESDNPVYGRTNNPWDVTRTCGGSSGGEAAIVAARGSPLGIGNDLGGSIRVPCHFCGLHGIRPTSYRMPRVGSMRTLRGFEAFVTQTGPMSRFVEDLWLGLQVLTDQSDGYVSGDVAPAPIGNPADVRLEKLKIVAWGDDGVFPPSPAVVRAVKEAARSLREQGAEVVELSPVEVEKHFHASEAFDLYCSLVGADGGADARRLSRGSTLDPRLARLLWMAGLPRPMRAVVVAGLRRAGQTWMARIVDHARPRSADVYWQLIERKNQLTARVLAHMRARGIGAIVCPPYALPATPHVRAFDLLAAASYSMLVNLLGWPSGTVSTTRVAAGEEKSRERSRDRVLRGARIADEGSVGLPVGVQVSSVPWREDVVLAVMGALEKAAAGNRDYPGNNVVPGGKLR